MGQLIAILNEFWAPLTMLLIGLVIVLEELGRVNRDGW